MKIQRINDERLKIQNLKNIRIIYALQTLGMISILGYNFVTEGIYGVIDHPLWIVFIASTVILAFLSFGKDERLVLKDLQKIRIAFAVQVSGIVGILGYDVVGGGMENAQKNPLWILFIVSTTILAFLSMNISVDYENNKNPSRKSLIISFIVLALISIIVGIFTALSEGFTSIDGILTGLVLFIVGFIPFYFLFSLRKRRDEDLS